MNEEKYNSLITRANRLLSKEMPYYIDSAKVSVKFIRISNTEVMNEQDMSSIYQVYGILESPNGDQITRPLLEIVQMLEAI